MIDPNPQDIGMIDFYRPDVTSRWRSCEATHVS